MPDKHFVADVLMYEIHSHIHHYIVYFKYYQHRMIKILQYSHIHQYIGWIEYF